VGARRMLTKLALASRGRRPRGWPLPRWTSYVIAISSLSSVLRKEQCLTGTIHFEEGNFPIMITVALSDPADPCVDPTRDEREGDRFVRDRIRLLWTVPTYGGRRWWFQCPRTGRRTTKLFLPNGGWHFWSRQAYGLGYACQREDRLGRLQRRAAKLNRQLGGDGWAGWDTPPIKPKWMRWRTLRAEIRNLGASGRESQRGVYGARRAPFEVDLDSSLPSQS
jgi:hypothetical protein